MGLALPLALLGLLSVAIPLWLHRVRRKTLRDVALPTIGLLQRAVVQKRRTLSFLDRPLLYARVALAALCALALTKPYLSRLASYATERPIALAIIIDDSMSMHRRAQRGGDLFEVAQGRANRVLAELAPESEAAVVLGGNAPRLLASRTDDLAGLREKVASLAPLGARGTALTDALSMALRQVASSKLSIREVLILTDCASHAAADTLDSSAAHVRVECIAARNAQPNAYITGMKLSISSEVAAPSTLHVSVAAGPRQSELELSLHADGRSIGEHVVAIQDGIGQLEVPIAAGALRGARVLTARIETSNAIAEDDVRELMLDDHADLTVLLVDGDPAPNQLDDELRFAALALSVDDGARALPQVTRIDADGLEGADLSPYDVVVLANVRAPVAEVAAGLERYVARGGGLLIAAGDHVDAFAYRGSMGNLLPAVVRSSAPAEPPLTLRKDAVDSPLVPEQGRGLETAGTNKRLLLEPTVAPNQTLLAFGDGSPLLAAGQHGNGTVALLTTTLDDDWTDLPLTPGFLPLLNGLVRGLASVDALPPGPHAAGTVLTTRPPLGATSLFLVTPDGRRIDLDVRGTNVTIRDTAVTGAYRAFAVLDGREQELEQLSFLIVPDVTDSELTLRPPKPEGERKAAAGASRARGVEGWFWLLLGLLGIAEGALRLVGKRPSQPSAA